MTIFDGVVSLGKSLSEFAQAVKPNQVVAEARAARMKFMTQKKKVQYIGKLEADVIKWQMKKGNLAARKLKEVQVELELMRNHEVD